eukprot:scaffold2300_cov160-Amphora_coffeaeformis.AAC.6
MLFCSGKARASMLKAAARGTVRRGYLRGYAALALSTTRTGMVEASSSSSYYYSSSTSSNAGSIDSHAIFPREHIKFQRRYFQSFDSIERQSPLDILREVHQRILQDKEYSPVLSSHQRGPSTNISTLESKATVAMAGTFGRLYRNLPAIQSQEPADQCPRRRVLQFLARDCSVDRKAVDKAVEVYHKVLHEGELTPHLATYSRLHDVSAPLYHDILRYLLLDHACEGMESIICIREDVRAWLRSLHARDEESVDLIAGLKRLDQRLQEILSVWFVPGLLEHRRITYETTSASVLEYIVRHEAVHPVSSLRDLRRRLGPDRRVFAIFHPTLSEQPLFVLYVALLGSIPTSMATIQKAEESAVEADAVQPAVACFYSISNLRKGLVGVGMGEYLIHETVEHLQKEIPSLQTFCTLSPIPGFRQWLESDVHRHDWITQEDRQALADSLGCSADVAVTTLLERLEKSLDDHPNLSAIPTVRQVMMRWAAHYLFVEKHRRKPLDRVARFHVSNGAIMDQLHWGADLSPKGWRNSFGIMVTYRYDLLQLPLNQRNFESNNLIPLGECFSQYLN